jgi:hypothetical protein
MLDGTDINDHANGTRAGRPARTGRDESSIKITSVPSGIRALSGGGFQRHPVWHQQHSWIALSFSA